MAKKLSKRFVDLLNSFDEDFVQVGDLPVWIGKTVVVKLPGDREYLDAIVHAHEKLDPLGMSSRLLDTYVNDEAGEYGVIEEKINGKNLASLPVKKAKKLIQQFESDVDEIYPIADWDGNPENYIIDKKTGTIKVIDLGDLYFEDSP